MKQGEDEKPKTRKRQISIITVFLWIFLIVTMVAITATGMKNQNALEGDDTTSVEIIKNWMGMEPSSYEVPSITLQVKDGKKVVAEHDVTSADNWRYTFTNLPKYREDGTEIHYTVGEAEEFIELADGYYSLDRIEGNTIYNGFTFKVSGGTKDDYITITKKWNDNNNELGLRPESVVVRLTGIAAFSGTVELNERIELSEKNDWSYTFCNRGVLRDIPVNYTVEEESTNTSYECNVSGGQTGYNDIWSFEITNTLNVPKIETTSVEVIKDWMGRKPSIDDVPSITLQVKDGETVVAEHKVTSADNWRYTFTDLPKYRADGTEINYTVGEVETLIYAKNGFFYLDRIEGNIIYNAFRVEGGPAPENHYIYIKKIWNDNNNELGLRPENVKIKVKSSAGFQSEELELNEENNWYAYIVNRGVYSYQKHKYTVDEEYESELYQSDIQVEQNDYSNVINITITNTLMVPDEKVQIEVMKTWDDNDNESGKRPESITLQVKNHGVVVAEQVVTEANDWKHTFELPKYNETGDEIEYTVDEELTSEFYVKNIVGNVITNQFVVPEDRIKFVGRKVWEDNGNAGGKRDSHIILQVKAGEKVVAEAEVSEENNWTYEFELAKYDRYGNEIEYHIDERETGNKFYEKELTDSSTVTNRFVVPDEVVIVKAVKKWEDKNDLYGKRPGSVTLQVLVGDKVVGEEKVNEKNNWSYEFKLPKYDESGDEIEYTVDEKNTPNNYEKKVEGYTVINTCTYEPLVDTGDMNIWIYLVIFLVAIVGVIVGILIVKKNTKTTK